MNQVTEIPPDALANWIPVRLLRTAPALSCAWLFTGGKAFTEPFFDETIAACRYAHANNRRYRVLSGLDTMVHWASARKAIAPAAIIFHVSRCGSTLLSQLLGEDKQNRVLSEVPFFDELLRLPYQQVSGAPPVGEYLNAAIQFYGQQGPGGPQQLFIKTDSWHLHFYQQYRELFPGIPFFLLYRHPLPVIRSQQKQRGLQSVPGLLEPEITGFSKKQAAETNLDHYMAHFLASCFQKMITIAESDPMAFLLHYAADMNSLIRTVYARLNRRPGKALEERFAERCRFHAKRPHQLFTEEEPLSGTPPSLQTAPALYHRLRLVSTKTPAAL